MAPDDLEPDDLDAPGYARPYHTHPHLIDRGDTGHAHPDGGLPHVHIGPDYYVTEEERDEDYDDREEPW